MPEPTGASITVDDLLRGWTPRRIGRRIEVFGEVDSTNQVVLSALSRPGSDGLVVMADFQSSGRGRQGRTWLSPRGAGILCSVGLITRDPTWTGPGVHFASDRSVTQGFGGLLTLVSAVAACEAIRRATEVTPAIKWPNDLRVNGRKLGGILIESRLIQPGSRGWVVGLGINCLQHAGHFPPELREIATSLELAASHPIDRMTVARELLRSLDYWLADEREITPELVHSAWMGYAEPLGQPVRLLRHGLEVTGRTLLVDPTGGLVLQCDDGRREWFDPLVTTSL